MDQMFLSSDSDSESDSDFEIIDFKEISLPKWLSIDFSDYLPFSMPPLKPEINRYVVCDDIQVYWQSCSPHSFLRPVNHCRLHFPHLKSNHSSFLMTVLSHPWIHALGTGIQLEHWMPQSSLKTRFAFHSLAVPHITGNEKGLKLRTEQTIIPCTPFSALYSQTYTFVIIDDDSVYSVNDCLFQINPFRPPAVPKYRKLEILIFLLHHHYRHVCQMTYIIPRVVQNTCCRFFGDMDVKIERVLKRMAVYHSQMDVWLLNENAPLFSSPILVSEITSLMNY